MKKFALLSLLVATVAMSAFARGPAPPDAPEIDPSSIAAASGLVCVGLVMIRGRKKR